MKTELLGIDLDRHDEVDSQSNVRSTRCKQRFDNVAVAAAVKGDSEERAITSKIEHELADVEVGWVWRYSDTDVTIDNSNQLTGSSQGVVDLVNYLM